MTQNDLRLLLLEKPFLPFRLHVSDGTFYDMHHPDQVVLTLATVHILIPGPVPSSSLWQRPLIISLRHVVRIEPLALATAPEQPNGPA
jgi:hypothetical protein